MNQPRKMYASWVAHTLEIVAAVGVLVAVAIPAFMFPPSDMGGAASAGEDAIDFSFEAAASPTGYSAPAKHFQRPGPKSAPNVSAQFAIESIRNILGRFDFARQMVIARPHVTDADIVELVQLAQMGDVAPTDMRAEELVFWDWLVNVVAIDLSAAGSNITDVSLVEIAKLDGIEELHLERTRTTDLGLKKLAVFKGLVCLDMSGTQITDEGLKALDKLCELELLTIDGTSVGDEGIAIVRNYPRLQSLSLNDTRVTGAALDYIAELTSLENLYCGNCPIDDRSLDNLAALRRLEVLLLPNSQVTDAGVRKLTKLDQLDELDLSGSKVGAAGRSLIESALPECNISF